MKYLLDTHTFIWWDSDLEKLSHKALELIQNPENVVLISTASIWEIQIKLQLGKLKLGGSLSEIIESQQKVNHFEVLPINLEHVLASDRLPAYHKDPFDRLLAAQALIEDAVLISKDPNLSNYPVQVDW